MSGTKIFSVVFFAMALQSTIGRPAFNPVCDSICKKPTGADLTSVKQVCDSLGRVYTAGICEFLQASCNVQYTLKFGKCESVKTPKPKPAQNLKTTEPPAPPKPKIVSDTTSKPKTGSVVDTPPKQNQGSAGASTQKKTGSKP
eukprot:TCONS_00061115-protein